MNTTHFLLPEFDNNGTIDLINIYNKAIQTIDINLFNVKKTADETKNIITNIKPFSPTPTDKILTVSQLANAKVASNGIIYFKI